MMVCLLCPWTSYSSRSMLNSLFDLFSKNMHFLYIFSAVLFTLFEWGCGKVGHDVPLDLSMNLILFKFYAELLI